MNCYGILLDPGPGDTLRFFNGFCELLKETKGTGVIFCASVAYNNVRTLFFHSKYNIQLIECKSLSMMHDKLLALPKTRIWYCFDIKHINWVTKRLPEEITNNTSHDFLMIDRYDNHKYMCGRIRNHLSLDIIQNKEKGLLFLRNMSICPERNINETILKAIIDVAKDYGIVFDIVSDRGTEKWDYMVSSVCEEKLYSKGYPDYLTQLQDYGRYKMAIGMNSGGLDLSIAAGVPSVRIGEFHQYYDWLGANYNSFLSSSVTVNIASNSETDISNIGKRQINMAIDILMKEHENRIYWI